MSSVSELFPHREDVYVAVNEKLTITSYQSLQTGNYYIIQLISGSYSIYCKTSLFDDDLVKKVKTEKEAIELVNSLKE